MAKANRGGNGGSGGGGVNPANIVSERSLISERENHREAVDDVLAVMRDVENQYGEVVEDLLVAQLKGKDASVLGFHDEGYVALNEKLLGLGDQYNALYDAQGNYHPSRGNKTGVQAVTAHEVGHYLHFVAGGRTQEGSKRVADDIVKVASRFSGYGNKTYQFRKSISGYAEKNNKEAVAEAFADVYCNGSKAKAESRAIVNELNKRVRSR